MSPATEKKGRPVLHVSSAALLGNSLSSITCPSSPLCFIIYLLKEQAELLLPELYLRQVT